MVSSLKRLFIVSITVFLWIKKTAIAHVWIQWNVSWKFWKLGKEVITGSVFKMGNLTLFSRTSYLGNYWKLSTAAQIVCVNKSTSILKGNRASKDILIKWNVSWSLWKRGKETVIALVGKTLNRAPCTRRRVSGNFQQAWDVKQTMSTQNQWSGESKKNITSSATFLSN